MARITTAAALAIVALLTGFAGEALACKGGNKLPNAQTVNSARLTLVCLANKQRRHHHLRLVHGHPSLTTAAQLHSDTMAADNFFAHAGSDGTPVSRASWAGYGRGSHSWAVGENLGFGGGRLGTPKAIFKAWIRSPGHRRVILDRRWREVGVGITIGSPLGRDGQGMATYTIDFGYRSR